MLVCLAVFAWQAPYYMSRCRRLLIQHWHPATNEGATSAVPSTAWLYLPLGLVFKTWILALFRIVHCASHAPFGYAVLLSFIDVSVTAAAILMIGRRAASLGLLAGDSPPEIVTSAMIVSERQRLPDEVLSAETPSTDFSEIENSPSCQRVAEKADHEIVKVAPSAKYRKSHLPSVVRDRIKRKLAHAFAQEERYRDSTLNLRSLCEGLKENAHSVSQVINQDLNSSFYQLVYHHRVERAKKRLIEAPDQTVLEIALFVGFNSKSTFNSAFRENTGMTPREYRANQLKGQSS
jgi:AraC-like DNA-binding protein